MSCKTQMPGGSSPPRVEYTHNEHWGCVNPKHRVLCKQNIQCPIPFPLPLFSPWAGQLLSSLPMGEKKGEGEWGWGSVVAAHTQWAALVSAEGQWKLCIILSSYFVKLINTTVRHPYYPNNM